MSIERRAIGPKGKRLAVRVQQESERPSKLAVLLPGYLDSKDYNHFRYFSEALARRAGYLVVGFDPSGTWGSDGDIESYTQSNYLANIKAVIDYFVDKEGPFKAVVLIGHSFGGTNAIIYAARDSRVTAVVATMAPPSYSRTSSADRIAAWEKEKVRVSEREYPPYGDVILKQQPAQPRIFKVPYSFVTDASRYKATNMIKSLKIPVLILTGTEDNIVPRSEVEELYEAANKPKEFVLLEGVDHDFWKKEKYCELVTLKIRTFLKEYKLA